MTPFSELVFKSGWITIMMFGLFLLLGQILLVVNVFSVRKNVPMRIISVVQVLCGSIWFCLLLDGSFEPDYFERERAFLPLTEWLYNSPWILIAGIKAAFAVILAISMAAMYRYRRHHLSQSAIKETVDMLPVGICFSKPDGTVVLKNLLADSLCIELTDNSLNDAKVFWDRIEERGEKQDQATIIVLPSGKAMMCQKSEITVDGMPYLQFVAIDSTELYHITSELREKNQQLLDIRARMKAFGEMAARLAMTEEILRARISVHDEMGHLLLSGKYYLDCPEEGDREKLLRMERYTHLLLMQEGEEPNDALPNSIEDAAFAAREMGVTVSISGDLPHGDLILDLLSRAIRECAANAIKHASGDSLSVRLSRKGESITAILSTNGDPPTEPIKESGGLLNLRRSVESAGGTMTVTVSPPFTLTLILPE